MNPSNTKNEEQGDNRNIKEWNTGFMMLQSFLYRSGSRPSMPYIKISVLAQEGIALEVRILVISLLLLITLPKKKTKVQVPVLVVGCEK